MSRLFRLMAVCCLVFIPIAASRADDPVPPWLNAQLAAAVWQPMAPGIERLAAPKVLEGAFAAYRLAQGKVTARVLGSLKPDGSTAEEVAKANGALLAVNGGFFFVKDNGVLHPTGLLIVGGAKQTGLKKCRACTGILFSDTKGLHIVRPAAFAYRKDIGSALQVGPMLVEAGRPLPFNADGPDAPRTAVCLSGEAIIVVVAIRPMTLHDLATLMLAKPEEGGFACNDALNLDGGSSSQLAAELPGNMERLGFSARVQNFIAFFPR